MALLLPFMTFRNSIQNTYRQFTQSDIKGLLNFLRWMNFFITLAVAVFLILSLFSTILSFNLNKLLLTSYCLLFNGILCLYELHMKKLGDGFQPQLWFPLYVHWPVHLHFLVCFAPFHSLLAWVRL